MSGRFGKKRVDNERWIAEVRRPHDWLNVSLRPRMSQDEAFKDAAKARQNYPQAQLRVRPIYGELHDNGQARRTR